MKAYTSLIYEDGDMCDGLPRSTRVLLECGNEDKITFVSEPAKCQYEMKMLSPVVCMDLPEEEELFRDEL
jgi:hypothetical protein